VATGSVTGAAAGASDVVAVCVSAGIGGCDPDVWIAQIFVSENAKSPATATHLVCLESRDNLVALAERLLLLLFIVELIVLQEVENTSRGRSRLGRIG
jgi:hypothetical protein